MDPHDIASGLAVLLALVSMFFSRVALRPDTQKIVLRGLAYAEQWGVSEAKKGRVVSGDEKRKMALDAAKELAPKMTHAQLHIALEAEIKRAKG